MGLAVSGHVAPGAGAGSGRLESAVLAAAADEAAGARFGFARGERAAAERELDRERFALRQAVLPAGAGAVVFGTIIRETIGTIAEARKTGFSPTFMGSSASYTDLIHKLGGKAMDGLYATMTVQNPYLDGGSKQMSFWANKYKTKFNEDPTVFSIYGYNAIDSFARAATKAGPNLTTDSFIKAMDSMVFESDMFGSAPGSFSPTKHLGSDLSRLSQIQDGRWKVVSEYLKPGAN